MLSTGLLSLGISASLQDTASGIFLLIIMIFTYNNQRILDYIASKKEHRVLAKLENS
jgi:ribose/xylose/arabinose/galactoside ABC-type transport system permease subunit